MKDIYVKDGRLFLTPNSAEKAESIAEKIQKLVTKTNASKINLNLCGINVFSSLRIAILTSTYGLTKNIRNEYEIIVDNEVTKAQINLLNLSNISTYLHTEIAQPAENLVAIKV